MRLADLLWAQARDADGEELGQVHDVRLRLEEDGHDAPRLVVESIIVGAGTVGRRLGYAHGGVEGPWLLARLFEWAARHAREAKWTDVRREARVLHVQRPRDELERPT